jgi:hypothetical protein
LNEVVVVEEEEEDPLFVLELAADWRTAANRFHLNFQNGVTEV